MMRVVEPGTFDVMVETGSESVMTASLEVLAV
jgi:hypothetical protein